MRDVLKGPCAVICAEGDLEGVDYVKGRELWLFHVKDADDAEDPFEGDLEGVDELESELSHFHDMRPVSPHLTP